MPTTRTIFLDTGNADTLNVSTLQHPGSLGSDFPQYGRQYQLVQLDSGATASASSGVVAANQVAYWKDRSKYLVTNDLRMSVRNQVAGIFRTAVTAGNYCAILTRGRAISVKSDGNGAAGDISIPNSGTSADATNVAAGTAPTYNKIGVIRGAASGGNISVDVDIIPIP